MKMALFNQAKIAARPTNYNALKCLFGGRTKETAGVIRTFATTLKRKGGSAADDASWTYRRQNPRPPPYLENMATGVMTLTYWWIFWHLFTEPGHVFGGSFFGEFDYPNVEEWTDEELGIPPDDYEE